MSRPEREQPGKRESSPYPDPTRCLEEAARSRASSELFLALCRLACSETLVEDVDRHFLKAVLDSLGIDRAAILRNMPRETSHTFQNSLGFPQSQTDFHPPHPLDAFYLVSTETDADPLADSLRKAVGVQNILWVFDDKSGKSLLLGNSKPKTRLGFMLDESCRKVAEAALNLYLGISEKKWIEQKSRELLDHVEKTTVLQAAESERLDLLFHHTSDVVLILKADSTVSYVSHSIDRILGYRPEDLVGTVAFEFIHPKDATRIRAAFAFTVRTTGATNPVELRVKHADGSWRHFEGVANNLLEDPAVAGIVVNAREITKRKLLEEEREQLLRNMGERVKELCCMYEVADSVRRLPTQEEIFKEVTALIPSGWQCPEITRCRVVFDGKVFTSEPFEETEWKQSSDIIIDGALRGCVEVFYLQERPEEDEGPFLKEQRILIDGIARTISEVVEHKQVDRERTELLKTLEAAREAIHITSSDGVMTYTNSAMEELFGYERGELLGKNPSILFAGPEPMAVEKVIVDAVEEDGVWEGDVHNKRKDGTEFISHARITARRDEEGRVVSFLSTQHDITERKQSEKRQQFSNHLLEIANRHTKMKPLLDDFVVQIQGYTGCSAVGIRMLDEQGNISYQAYRGFSEKFCERESCLSIHSDEGMCIRVITGDIDPKLSCFTASGCFYMNGTTRFLTEVSEEDKGSTRNECNRFGYEAVALVPIQVRDRITGLIHVADERTDVLPLEVVEVLRQAAMQLGEAIERVMAREAQDEAERQLEEQRALSIASDRLRSLGEMAAGIAHELNQPLVGVRGLAEHIMIGLDRGWTFSDENIRKKVQLIVEQSERMTHIIDHVRVFAKEAGRPEVRRVQVNDVILSSTGLVNAQLRARGMELKFGLTEDLPFVLVNPFSLEEVILNLISNARDAIEEKMSKDAASAVTEILLRTREGGEPHGGDDRRVLIEVVDQGIGISEDNLPKVFDPFFTTKGPDKGTGLGLAVSKSIIEEFGGTLEIQSELNRGATAIISLKAEPLDSLTRSGPGGES